MISAIFPGSFDPVTKGHEDIIKRSSRLVDKLYVSPSFNYNKNSLFSLKERILLLNELTKDLNNIEVVTFKGLLVDFVKTNNITYIIKGVRNTIDFEQESQMANINNLIGKTETILIPTNPNYSSISSTLIKEILANNGDISNLVPPCIMDYVIKKGKKHD